MKIKIKLFVFVSTINTVSLTIRLYFLPRCTTVTSRGHQTVEHHWHTLDNGVRISNQLAYTSPASNMKNLPALMQNRLFKSKMENQLSKSYFHVKYLLNFTNRIITSSWTLLSALQVICKKIKPQNHTLHCLLQEVEGEKKTKPKTNLGGHFRPSKKPYYYVTLPCLKSKLQRFQEGKSPTHSFYQYFLMMSSRSIPHGIMKLIWVYHRP